VAKVDGGAGLRCPRCKMEITPKIVDVKVACSFDGAVLLEFTVMYKCCDFTSEIPVFRAMNLWK